MHTGSHATFKSPDKRREGTQWLRAEGVGGSEGLCTSTEAQSLSMALTLHGSGVISSRTTMPRTLRTCQAKRSWRLEAQPVAAAQPLASLPAPGMKANPKAQGTAVSGTAESRNQVSKSKGAVLTSNPSPAQTSGVTFLNLLPHLHTNAGNKASPSALPTFQHVSLCFCRTWPWTSGTGPLPSLPHWRAEERPGGGGGNKDPPSFL